METAGDLGGPDLPWYRSPRARLFGAVLVVVFAAGCLYTVMQERVWRSAATVLMSAPVALDETVESSNLQGVAIQSRRLLGSEVVAALSVRLEEEQGISLPPADLEDMLRVDAVTDTNLVEMSAEGSDRDVLPLLVTGWIDIYLAIRAEDVASQKSYTLRQLEDEQSALQSRLQQARDALDAYRREHGIVSAQREENAVLAQLEGLNRALNNAVEEEVLAGAYLETLRQAIRRGEPVVPQSRQLEVQSLERELRDLQAEMAAVEKRYTEEYIAKHTELRAKVERIEELQRKLDLTYESGREAELTTARQAHAVAQQAVKDLQDKLARHRESVAEFTRIYATHEALVEDLARLEELNRENQAREVQVSIQDVDKYPQVTVIQKPPEKSELIGPDYRLLLGGSFGLAFVLAILCVWLRGFLGHQSPKPTYVSVEVVPPGAAPSGTLEHDGSDSARLQPGNTPRLEGDADKGS